MSSALVKKQLKAAREALNVKNYAEAIQAAEQVLQFESNNYNARVFLALAQLNSGLQKESEINYEQAIDAQPDTPLAYQGLSKLYESTEQWHRLNDLSIRMLHLYDRLDDAQRAAEVLQKLLHIVRRHLPPSQLKQTLTLLLPDSFIYPLLSSNLPPPDPTAPLASGIHDIQLLLQNNVSVLDELIQMEQTDESNNIIKETDKRRMRLSSGKALSAEQTKRAVQAEVMPRSKLPELWRSVLDHPQTTDAQRRAAESKLLWHQWTLLISLSTNSTLKNEVKERVQELAQGMVLIRLPDPKAWEIVLDWADVDCVEAYDEFMLKQLLNVFGQDTPLHQITLAHRLYRNLELEEDKGESPDIETLIQTAIENGPSSLFIHIVAASYYVDIKDWMQTKAITESALQLLDAIQSDAGLSLSKTQTMLSTWLGTSLVFLDAPAHHRQALKVLTEVLSISPSNLPCLIGQSVVLSASEQWEPACQAIDTALELCESDEERLQLKSDRAWCLIGLQRLEEAMRALKEVISTVEEKDEQGSQWDADRRAMLWWRMGRCYGDMGGEYQSSDGYAYAAFISALKICPTFAPSFTYLGMFYMDVVNPPDLSRGPKCYQKALELDPQQDEAARRLAEVHAASDDWDLVEAIARRVLAALPGRSALEEAGAAWIPLASHTTFRYSWAWKAVGMADFKNGKHMLAVRSLQHALRGDPHNGGTLLWLGIAYQGSGKHIAALKTFGRVVQLEPDNWVAYHLAAEIQRSIGLMTPAISNLLKALSIKPEETGVIVVLAETTLTLARNLLRQGYRTRALDALQEVLRLSVSVLEGQSGQRSAAKLVSDATLEFSRVLKSMVDEDKPEEVKVKELFHRLAGILAVNAVDDKFTGLGDHFSVKRLEHTLRSARSSIPDLCRAAAVLFAKFKLLLEPPDSFTLATAWADLGTVLHQVASVEMPKDRSSLQSAAVRCLREALKRDPRNPHFWNTLGVISFELSARLCQHAFIRASEYDSRSAWPWTNLGIFYLHHDDWQLANKAFLKAQVLDPEWPQVWLGQACLAALHGDERERRVLISHAWMLAGGTVAEADLEFAHLPFEPSLPLYNPPSKTSALHAISRYNSARPEQPYPHLLQGMLSEDLSSWKQASTLFSAASAWFERAYQCTSSEQAASSFIQAKLGEGRSLCAENDPTSSLSASQAALDPLEDVTEVDPQQASFKILGYLQLGLAHWLNEAAEEAMTSFEAGSHLASASGNSPFVARVGVLLARCLANLGGDDGLQEAKTQLLAHITDPESGHPNMEVVTTLSALAIIQRDDELLHAAIEEIEKLPLDLRVTLDPAGDVVHLLVVHHLLRGDIDEAQKVLIKALHASPDSTSLKLELARLQLDTNNLKEAQGLVLLDDETNMEPENEADWCVLRARLSLAHGNGNEATRMAQRALHLRPDLRDNREVRELIGIYL